MKTVADFARSLEKRFADENWYRYVGIDGPAGKESIFLYAKTQPTESAMKIIQEQTEFPVTVRVIGKIRAC